LTHSAAPSPAFEGGVKKRRSELALSEAEGVDPERSTELTPKASPSIYAGESKG